LRRALDYGIDRIQYAADGLGATSKDQTDLGIAGAQFSSARSNFLLHLLYVGMAVAKPISSSVAKRFDPASDFINPAEQCVDHGIVAPGRSVA
jgi:hypothetical protein